jgi:hypothetical protein
MELNQTALKPNYLIKIFNSVRGVSLGRVPSSADEGKVSKK